MSPLTKIVIVGASGNLGPSVLKALMKSADNDITVVSRQSSKASFDPNVKVVKVSDSYPEDEMLEVFKGQDAVVFTVGHAAAGRQMALIDVAIKARVKRFIPTEFGSNSQNKGAVEVFPMLSHKAHLIDYLKSKESTGLTWTAIANGPFFDFCLTTGFLGFVVDAHKATIYDSGDVKFSTTTRATVGTAVASVLSHPEETANKYLYISSFEVTENQILASLENASIKNWDITNVTSDEQVKVGRQEMAAGNLAGMGKLLLASTFKGGLGANFATEEKLANEVLGLPEEKLDDVVVRVLKDGS